MFYNKHLQKTVLNISKKCLKTLRIPLYTLTVHLIMFLVGAFSFKEKSPTITVASFFSFFFRQTTELIVHVPLFTETDKFTQAKFDQCKLTAKGPPFRFLPFLRNLQNRKTPKGPPFQFFSALCEFFFENFKCLKSPPSDFLIFCNRKYVNESQRVPPFHFSALCDILKVFFQKIFFQKFYFVSSREK